MKKNHLISVFILFFILIFPFNANSQCTLVINDPPTVCEGLTVDITLPAVTEGSSEDLTFTYWQDTLATIALTNPTAIDTSGTFFIKAEGTDNCADTLAVHVTIVDRPNLVINDPPIVCAPGIVDITKPEITAGSDPGLTITYWLDASGTLPLTYGDSIRFSGTFYIKATALGGCLAFKPVNVEIIQSPTLTITNPDLVCLGGFVDLTLEEVSEGSTEGLVFTYWEDMLATLPLNRPDSVFEAGTYYIMGSTVDTSCIVISPVEVRFIEPFPLNIAITTVDHDMGKNKIIWDPTVSEGIESINIFKKNNVNDQFELLVTLPDFSVGEYLDDSSDPDIRADSYQVSLVDSCGNESDTSALHTTVFLMGGITDGNDIGLSWNAYEGTSIGFYLVYRKGEGENYQVIGSVIGSVLTYIDESTPDLPVTYMIEAIPSDPVATLDNKSYSNVITIETSSIDVKPENQDIKVFPVPFTNFINLELPDEEVGGTIEMHNLLGELVSQSKILSSKHRIFAAELPKGTYLLSIQGNKTFRRLVVK